MKGDIKKTENTWEPHICETCAFRLECEDYLFQNYGATTICECGKYIDKSNIELPDYNILKATYIIEKAKEKHFPDSEWKWAIEELQKAFSNGYEVVKLVR